MSTRRSAPKSKRRRLSGQSGSTAVAVEPDAAVSVAASAAVTMRSAWADPEERKRLRSAFFAASPYPHVMLRPFLGAAGLQAVRADLEKAGAVEKETDLFRFFQTGDIASALLQEAGSPDAAASQGAVPSKKRRRGGARGGLRSSRRGLATRAPNLAALARTFASDEFRELCAEVTQCGELSNRLDLSAQVYPKGGHLLCHDDVIGTRKISFIYYLTDPDGEWQPSEGGALELYPQVEGAARGTPAAAPTTEILPLADALVMFLVEPGVSFHAVREVRGSRARVSLQGWLHAPSLEKTMAFENRGLATLQQLLEKRALHGGDAANVVEDSNAPATGEDTEVTLTSEDTAVLSKWLSPEYLDIKHMQAVAERFAEDSYAVLTGFLREDVASSLSRALAAADRNDGFGVGVPEAAVPQYRAGAVAGWSMVGPPHLRRYLRFAPTGTDDLDAAAAAPSMTGTEAVARDVGLELHRLAQELFRSAPFRRWIQVCTRLEPRNEGHIEVRRFRPGLDYTVAARAETATPEAAELDVTLAVVADGDATSAELWGSEDVGGFESYVAADEDEDEKTAEVQETYRGADADGPLVNLPAASNALCLVMRDAKTLRFLKYLSRDAPSSRIDVAASYMVDPPADDSEEEQGSAAAPAKSGD